MSYISEAPPRIMGMHGWVSKRSTPRGRPGRRYLVYYDPEFIQVKYRKGKRMVSRIYPRKRRR